MWNLRVIKRWQAQLYKEAIARKIAQALVWLQGNIVHFLQRIERRMPLTRKKAIFLAFVTACSAWCSYTFFRAVFPASKSPPAIARGMNAKRTK